MSTLASRTSLLILCALLLIFFSPPQQVSQDKRPARVVAAKHKDGQCTISIFNSPRLRGFYLYQTEPEITALLPSFRRAYEAAKDPLLPVHDLISDFREIRSDGLEDDLTKIEAYRDVTFVWQFFNSHVAQLRVTYQEYEPENLDDFVDSVSSTTGLPPRSFRVVDKHTAVLACDGFSVLIREGSYTNKVWGPNGSQIILTDTEAFTAIDEEEKEVKKQRAKEEEQKQAEAVKKKRTFKP